ncbi:PREDICTED: uncharacterized protein LOC109339918 [Lupinus angustifolius]|uniref:uncharacterized protein LOC109339918 n=1 Tax=Lupinus angustifolius TaxID=3871 RepID=UPI00092F9C12|nr:PREDICTED: uncharacterized protein LOC109339918 [Lupinus angustifolius]
MKAGPSPFKFNNFWVSHKDFRVFVSNVWSNMKVSDWYAFMIHEKLHKLKVELKIWNRESFGSLDHKLIEISKEVMNIDLEGEEFSLSQEKVALRQSLVADWWKFLKMKDSLLFQKSKSRWLKEEDANTKFFHASIRGRRSRNQIHGLSFNVQWCEDVNFVADWVTGYFMNQFSENLAKRPRLDGVDFNTLSSDQQSRLYIKWSVEEIKADVWGCARDKSSEPNGFNCTFFQEC